MRRISRWISLATGVALIALAAFFWLRAGATVRLVDDEAGLMADDQLGFVADYHRFLLEKFDIDYRVVTGRGMGDINRAAVDRFEQLARAIRSKSGRGLLLLIDADADKVRLEVGYALEGAFPDAFVAYVEQRQMVPYFEHGQVADGIVATTELIIERAKRAAANAGFDGEAWFAGSGGAGATTTARLDAGPRRDQPERRGSVPAGRTPSETFARYIAVLNTRNRDPDLGIYTPETRRMLAAKVTTPAQMDSSARALERCRAEAPRIGPGGRFAVIRHPPAQRECPPYFFRHSDAGWQLDLATMRDAIRFNYSNYWHFDRAVEHPYRFAFGDWRFDDHGFPRIPK